MVSKASGSGEWGQAQGGQHVGLKEVLDCFERHLGCSRRREQSTQKMPVHLEQLAPEETLPSRLKTTGRAGRAP